MFQNQTLWRIVLALSVGAIGPDCSESFGSLADSSQLGFHSCTQDFDCGSGRYCSSTQVCQVDCRSSADCALIGDNLLCTRSGRCTSSDTGRACTSLADCDPGRLCAGVCTSSKANCTNQKDCPYPTESCRGDCAAYCGRDDDCLSVAESFQCTPVSQCLAPGWERWIPPGVLPVTTCREDAQCLALGFSYRCRAGECLASSAPIDFGDGSPSSPAYPFRGVWGMRMQIGAVTIGLPLVNRQNVSSSHLFLVKIGQTGDSNLVLEEKLCDLQLINFLDDDKPVTNLAWLVIPQIYLKALPILRQSVDLTAGNAETPFVTSDFVELRGARLANPRSDSLPTRADYLRDPSDPRFFDQDGDGKVGLTSLMDGVLRGEIYSVQRWGAIYRGQVLDPDHIQGLAQVSNEQRMIHSSNPNLIYETTTENHAQVDRTFFRMQRLPSTANCADLIRQAGSQNSWLRHSSHFGDVSLP